MNVWERRGFFSRVSRAGIFAVRFWTIESRRRTPRIRRPPPHTRKSPEPAYLEARPSWHGNCLNAAGRLLHEAGNGKHAAGLSVRPSRCHQEPRIELRGHTGAGPRHRREHSDLQCGICGVAPAAAIPGSGPAGGALADTPSFRLASASFL